MATKVARTVAQLPDLVPRLRRADGFAEVLASLADGQSATIDGAWGSSSALAAAVLAREGPQTLLVVLPRIGQVDEVAADVAAFAELTPLVFPAWETLPQEQNVADAVFGGRLRAVETLTTWEGEAPAEPQRPDGAESRQRLGGSLALPKVSPPRVVVTSLPALLQPVPSRAARERATRVLRTGDELDPEELLRWLVERGFERVTAIEVPGEFSMHGGIVDLWPPDAVDPLRIEFFGDEIESIRRFDVETQRKLDDMSEARLTLVNPTVARAEDNGHPPSPRATARGGHVREHESSRDAPRGVARGLDAEESFLDSLPDGTWIVLSDLQDLRDEGQQYLDRLDHPRGLFSVPATLARCAEFPTVVIAPLAADSVETTCHLQIESIERFTGPRSEVLGELASVVGRDETVLIACHNEGERERMAELLLEFDAEQLRQESISPALAPRVQLCVGRVGRGFRMVREQIVVLSDHELFGRTELRRAAPRRKRLETRAIETFLDLKEGDLVVHLTHGIGRYRGMEMLRKEDQAEEHMLLEFRDSVRVFVPVSLIHLVQKYIGPTKAVPRLSQLGSTSWQKKKDRVARAVMDMASDMIRLQAAREAKPGISCPPDSHLMREFDAAFPYTETPDQLHAIVDVKVDMERPRPMDRLICGDVGYGKTEVAMRGAFKCIDAGRQIAVLVPTTVLAEQHYRTFCERMAEYPVTIEVLSRFRTKGEQKKILERMEKGAVDIVIGTHRLVQPDVRFRDLGLLVIDEEQRFGVEAKEILKHLRLEVDVLTLSATPIPRTLHMSLLGIRDISNLTTAPQDRQAVETRITRFDESLIRNAIVRELNRGGQVYFVHNRVYNIKSVADRIQKIVPEARIGIVHGQMSGDELEGVMLKFVSNRLDVLVATTIIESGLDIPNANTIFIHQADKYGLADLHQLRGRVGRYKHRAYCYLLLEEGRSLTTTAAKRLKAIEEFSELGAGFRIAMRDLEIRGAGNILGTEQSGHIATVGYELYCQLLENSVRRLKNEPLREPLHVALDLPVSAFFPNSYIPNGRQKIDLYRKLSAVRRTDELNELADELRDRFGPVPTDAQRLLELKALQLAARYWKIDDIHLEDKFAVFGYTNPSRIRQLQKRAGKDLRIVDHRHAYLLLPSRELAGDELVGHLKSVLRVK